MKHKERKLINHIRNYIRQQEQRLAKYDEIDLDMSNYSKCIISLKETTRNTIENLNAILKWYKANHKEKKNV